MKDVDVDNLTKPDVEAFFAAEYPLVRLFHFGNDWLFYDAKPHFVFVLSDQELNLLICFLRGQSTQAILKAWKGQMTFSAIRRCLNKFGELQKAGVFKKGPAEEISPVDPKAILQQLEYYDSNILLRKFCLEVTNDCNFRCTYCKRTIANGYMPHAKQQLNPQDAFQGIDYYFRKYTAFFSRLSREKQQKLLNVVPPSLSWYGGEPFLNFDLIRATAEYFKGLPWHQYGIGPEVLQFTSNTNLSIMNQQILEFLTANKVLLFASLDGPAEEHDQCRRYENGSGTFQVAYRNLLRIREFDPEYFSHFVSIFGVYTAQHDLGKCSQFNRSLGAFLCQHFPAEYTGAFVPQAFSQTNSFRRTMSENLEKFKTQITADGQSESFALEPYASLFPFAVLNFDHPKGANELNTLLTCPMGFDNLMVAANGDFLICHKVDESLPIGHCNKGLDFEKLVNLYQQYNRTVNNEQCRSCWSLRFCSVCAASRMEGGIFVNPAQEECDFFRLRTHYEFLCFCEIARLQPDLLKRIFAYRNDHERYIGIVDINDF